MQWQINLNCAAGKNKPLFGSILLCYTVFTATLKLGAAIPTERRMANADWAKPFILSAQRKLPAIPCARAPGTNKEKGAPKGPYFLKVRQLDKINILYNLGREKC